MWFPQEVTIREGVQILQGVQFLHRLRFSVAVRKMILWPAGSSCYSTGYYGTPYRSTVYRGALYRGAVRPKAPTISCGRPLTRFEAGLRAAWILPDHKI